MKVLLTNDDGIHAPGIFALCQQIEKSHEVIIAAPDDQRSACGHSITINRPIAVREIRLEGLHSKAYSIDGTPADCVRVALEKLVDGKVDMVLSGINRGSNLGTDVIYSGTVSAAIEAAIYKVPSIAISVEVLKNQEKYDVAAKYAQIVLEQAQKNHLKEDMVLNVNIPALPEEDIKGIKVSKIGTRLYDNIFIEKLEEDKRRSFEIIGNVRDVEEEGTDTYRVRQGYVTVTPLHYDLTNFKIINEIEKWF